MNENAIQTHDQLAATYLQQLQTLAFEISVAMDAIAANALTSFQESVAKQEMLCGVLANMANYHQRKSQVVRAAAAGLQRQFSRTKDSRYQRSDPRAEFAVCRAAQALRQVHCSSRIAVQNPHRSIPGGSRAQVEASDLVLRDVIYVLSEQRTQHSRTIAGR